MTTTIQELTDHARSLNSQVVISANNYDAVMRPSYVTHGIDLPRDFQVASQAPMLVETWRQRDTLQIHLVNYAQQPEQVTISFEQAVRCAQGLRTLRTPFFRELSGMAE